MKRTIIITLALLVLFNLSFPVFSDREISNAKKTAEFWSSYTDPIKIKYLHVLFDSIRFKKEKKFEAALDAFISLETTYSPENHRPELLSSPGKAHAIYTLAAIGGENIGRKFNNLLTDKLIFKLGIHVKQYDEKSEALKFMYDLGITPEPETIEYLRNELKGNEFPSLILKIVIPLMSHGFELTEHEKDSISKLITARPQYVKGSDILQIGIQPDWRKMLLNSHPRHRISILKMLLIAGETESRKHFIELSGDVDGYKGKFAPVKIVIAATAGNKQALDILSKSLTLLHLSSILTVPEYFPDEVLLGSLEFCLMESYQIIDSEFLKELESRGYTDEVDNYLNETIKILENDNVNDRSMRNKQSRSVRILLKYDSYSFMNQLSELFESHQSVEIAKRITFIISQYGSEEKNYRNREVKSGIEKWISNNPEILARVISTKIESHFAQDNDSEIPITLSRLKHIFMSMLYLPDEIFNKNFSQLKLEDTSQASQLVENYYNVDWDS